jgi:hypothetical protein
LYVRDAENWFAGWGAGEGKVLTKKKIDEKRVTVRARSRIVPTTSETPRRPRRLDRPRLNRARGLLTVMVSPSVDPTDVSSTMAGRRI